jgi:hypothetical protein
LEDFPSGVSKAPVSVTWLDVGKSQDLLFYGGIVALHQHPDGALEARTGWAVVEVRQKAKPKVPPVVPKREIPPPAPKPAPKLAPKAAPKPARKAPPKPALKPPVQERPPPPAGKK